MKTNLNIHINLTQAAIPSLVILLALSIVTIYPIAHKTEIAQADATYTEPTISLNSVNSNANVNLYVGDNGGTFSSSTPENSARFNLTTTNKTGYTLSVATDDDNGTLISEDDVIESIPTSIDESTFDTATYNNHWGLKPNKLNSRDNTNFIPSPTTEAIILDSTLTANATPIEYSIGIGARADYTKPTGTYSRTIIITAIANPMNYDITFTSNTTAGETISNFPADFAGDTTAESITIPTNIPARNNYAFDGWCVGTVSTDSGVDSCSSTIYQPGDSISIDQSIMNTFSFRALWHRKYMQDQTAASMAKLMPTHSSTTILYDRRDEEAYTLVNLNGSYWMTQNLRVSGTISAIDSNFTGADVNVTESSLTTGNTYTEARTITGVDSADNPSTWYNFCAATAKTGNGCTENARYTTSMDICPSGWRLPTTNEAASIMDYRNEFQVVTGGSYWQGELTDTIGAYWWTATALANAHQSAFGYSGGNFKSTYYFAKSFGNYVRCIYSGGVQIPRYLQDQTAETLAAALPNVGDTITLYDNRDEEPYLIGKLADENYWFLDNLRLGGNEEITINSDNSNIDPNFNDGEYTLPISASYQPQANYFNYLYADYKDTVASTVFGQGSGKFGVYYNYCTLSGGKICQRSSTIELEYDICPKNWHVPSGGPNSDFSNLYESYDSDANVFRTAFSAVYSGDFYSNYMNRQNEYLFLWTSTRKTTDDISIYHLGGWINGEIQINDNHYRHNNCPVRCVFSL